jgi:purine-binding chemotaxis protein CheW
MASEELLFTTFTVANLYLGIEVDKVQEVLRHQPLTRVPLVSSVISGLINLRGQIVTAIDLRQRLGLPPRPAKQQAMNVIVRSDDGAVSLLVDEIGDVLAVTRDMSEPLPDTVKDLGRELIRGIYKVDGRLLLIIDAEQAINPNAHFRTGVDEHRGAAPRA